MSMAVFSDLSTMMEDEGKAQPEALEEPPLKGRSVTADVHTSHRTKSKVVQKYRILGKKGEGSFAEVMACQNLSDGQLYACKRLKRHFVGVEQALSLTEVRALRRLRPHVNVVQLHDIIFDKKSGRLALIFELMDLNLYELLKARRKPLPEFRVKNYMYQLLKSLDHIHRHGIFHRDVKPENLLIRDNLLKLGDFGSCRGINTKKPYTEYISTRWYRPPECLLTSGYYSYKMDMWAAGCVFFEALTNLPLFPGSSELDQLAKIHSVIGTPKQPVLTKLRRHKRAAKMDFNFDPKPGIGVKMLCPIATDEAQDLLVVLLSYDEEDRPSARHAIRHIYFDDLRQADKYLSSRNSSAVGKRTASGSKQSSPSSDSKNDNQLNSDTSADSVSYGRKKQRSTTDQSLLLPLIEVSSLRQDAGSRSTAGDSVKCNTNRSVNFPPIEKKLARRKLVLPLIQPNLYARELAHEVDVLTELIVAEARRHLARTGQRLPPIPQQRWRF